MPSFNGVITWFIVILFGLTVIAEEKSASKPAAPQVATAVKSQTATETPATAVKKESEAAASMAPCKSECIQGMHCGQMVESGNGGVIILLGNRLLKYDANLTLVKEVEIKVQEPAAKKMEKPKAPEAKPAVQNPAEPKPVDEKK